ncbi:hypothetical protein KUTeg_001074 [Tegillarca granosa]|uniref:C2H2-type domain-containing protein n=1 Tax=Tegillarca granosa TaxID=220873 RepID=A0ABQ9FX67_TEGGR|nr:hypothetical protein KUTeg_001074 [Tegillarca granosa]
MYRKKGKESGGNEWVCVHCDLTFDNSNLLNLHTLTHAAENIGLDEVRRFAYSPYGNGILTQQDPNQNGEVVSIESSLLACPVCQMQFQDQRALIEHAAEHGTAKRKLGRDRPHKCDKCWKAFHTQERLQRHMLCHGEEDSKPLQCDVCFKRFMNNSALSCHMKTHSDRKYYECPICHEGFDHTAAMKDHVVIHAVNGIYTCPECSKHFDDFFALRKHMRGFHTNKEFPCPDCDKKFPRPDKLKLHMLRHSTHREFMCENCGRQFKRKDKLKEHIRRMHSLEREAKNATRGDRSPTKKFVPKVSPTDYHRFIYKCHACLLGFKRRGMLVNHLAKRHPEVKPDTVPELNLPILKTQKDYYCNYCDKVYKSSSKRKAHIIKNHPGASLPLSSRKKSVISEIPGLPNPTFSQTVGSITTMPHSCEFCHKQYASKAKLTQHQRKKHPESVPPLPPKPKRDMPEDIQPRQEPQPSQEAATIHHVVRYPDGIAAVQQQPAEGIQAADLLTQAMSELTQTLQEYRQPVGEYHVQARIGQTGTPTMVQVQAHLQQNPHSTIELSHLGQTLAHAHFSTQQGTAAMVTPVQVAVAGQLQQLAQPQQQEQQSQTPQISQGQQAVQSAAPQTQQSQTVIPQTIVVSGAPNQAIPVTLPPNTFIARNWPNYQNYR